MKRHVSDDEIVALLPMVRAMVYRLTGFHVDHDELVGVGTVALVQAANRYEQRDGGAFSGWATLKVRGAILDELRRMEGGVPEAPKSYRGGRVRRLCRIPETLIGSLDALITPDETDSDSWMDVLSGATIDPSETLDARADVERFLSTITGRDRAMLEQVFLEDQPMAQVGERHNLSERRVSQIVGRGLRRIQEATLAARRSP